MGASKTLTKKLIWAFQKQLQGTKVEVALSTSKALQI